jgi:hypothetical protein
VRFAELKPISAVSHSPESQCAPRRDSLPNVACSTCETSLYAASANEHTPRPGPTAPRRPHQLTARHWAAHVRHGVTGLEEHGRGPGAHVAHHEPPFGELLDRVVEHLVGFAIAGGEAFDDAFAVGVGLQGAQRVLRGDEHAHAEGAGLFHELHERAFGGRVVGVGRQKAVHLVEHDEGA